MEKTHEPADLTLAIDAARGDEQAFAQLFHRHYAMIHALAYRISLDAALAEEIAHETFLKAARSFAGFRGTSSFKGWLYRIATNAARDALRRCRRDAAFSLMLASEATVTQGERRPDFSHVEAALAALSEDLRTTVVLVFYEDLTHAEAAAILGCAETTVSWRLFRAKRKLKNLLQR